jgi:hypothetical protein
MDTVTEIHLGTELCCTKILREELNAEELDYTVIMHVASKQYHTVHHFSCAARDEYEKVMPMVDAEKDGHI